MATIELDSPLVFVWNESGNYIEQIIICDENFAIDTSKEYKIIFQEVENGN